MTDPLKKYEFYRNENGVLYCGDCLEILTYLSGIELVITDPPYGMNFQSNYRADKYDKIINDDKPIEVIINAIKNKAKIGTYIFCRWDNLLSLGSPPKSVLCWVKNNWSMGDLEHEHGRQWEAICFYQGPQHEFKKRIPDVLLSPRTGNPCHPTQKPVGLIVSILEAYHKEHIVCDPYLGSGTTAIAAERLNRRWIGIEISEEYCAISQKRIEKERKQIRLPGF